ncbi:MAG TPA: hypothetical protein VLT36_20260 [Candidatus Dormibacteraeota bacterium]|nr:hypothetical protein [Candidatus Dormibacteraeota bacterium]
MSITTIDLGQYHEPGTILLSGRPKGVALRQRLNLDKLDRQQDVQVEVIVPREIVSLNSSFFSGLFGPSIREMGEYVFRSKYAFTCQPQIKEDVEAGIREALNRANPLSKPCR